MNLAKRLSRRFERHATEILLTVVLLVLCAALGVASEYFLTLKNIKNILEAMSFRLILALGMTLVIATGAIDLSAGSMLSLCGVLMALALKAGWPVFAAIALGLLCGAGMGGVNGLVITRTKINPLIVTLAFMSMYRGLALILTQGIPITKFPAAFLYWGRSDVDKLNPPLVLAAVLFLALLPLVYRTKWGQYIMALGGNEHALRRQGVSAGLYRVTAHASMGVAAALAGLVITARLNSAEANAGLSMEIDAITAVIMGGTPLSGGRASLYGTLVAVLLLGVIRNALTILSVSSYYQQFIIGFLLLCSVVLAKFRGARQP